MTDVLAHLRSWHGVTPGTMATYERAFPMTPTRETNVCRAILDKHIAHVRDLDADLGFSQAVIDMGHKSALALPLLRDDPAIGAIFITASEPGGFTDTQAELLKTFAEQAVIAIGGAETFRELHARTTELTRSVAELQALEEVLRAVNSSLDLETVLATIIDRAVPLAQADEGMIYEFDTAEQVFVPKAAFGMTEDRIARLRERRIRIGETYLGTGACSRACRGRAAGPLHARGEGTASGHPRRTRGAAAARGQRRWRPRYPPAQRRRLRPRTITLMQTFAAQSVLAIENARLFEAARRARAASDAALSDLRRAQDRLVQTEKMASLGRVTAGIAHEIRNPLNFVNNFSALSTELIDELQEALAPAPIDPTLRAEVDDLTTALKSNL